MHNLTVRQLQVLAFIRERIRQTGAAPTRWEMAKSLSFKSPKALEECLQDLAKKGLLALDKSAKRGIRVLEPPREVGLPLVGRVPEGQAAPQWLSSLLQSLTSPHPGKRFGRDAWVQQSLF